MKFLDRLLTIIVTATVTSAIWIVFGPALMSAAQGSEGQVSDTEATAPQTAPEGEDRLAPPAPTEPEAIRPPDRQPL